MENKQLSLAKTSSFYLLFGLLMCLVAFLFGELITRGFQLAGKKHILRPPYDNAQKDQLLGWKTTPNYIFSGTMQDSQNQSYPVELSYDQNGFKAFGKLPTTKPKLFFIGDSYTSSIEVSNEKSYFHLIGDSLDVEIFAYGQSGYGTLQEYLILDQYLDTIQPDFIIWQVSVNDFVDNDYELELLSGYKVGLRRPYLTLADQIIYQQPIKNSQRFFPYSQFLSFVCKKWETYQAKDQQIAEAYLPLHKTTPYPPFSKAVSITEQIVHKIKKRLPATTQLIAFSADRMPPSTTEFKRIFEAAGFPFLMKPVNVLRQARADGQVVHARDKYHWNNAGHEIIAKELIEYLQPLVMD